MVADDDLGRAAAAVDDQRALVGQVVDGAGIGGRLLLVAGEHFGLDAKQAAHPVEELLTVGGVPGRTGRHHPGRHDAEAGAQLGVARQHLQGAFQGRGVQAPGAVDALAQAGDHHLAGVLLDDPVAGHVGDDQAGRAGPDVDGGQPHGILPGGPGAAPGSPAPGSPARSTHGPGQSIGSITWRTIRPTGSAPVATSCAYSACRHLTRPGRPPTPGSPGSRPSASRWARYCWWAARWAAASSGEAATRSDRLAFQPAASGRPTATPAAGHDSQYSVGKGVPSGSNGEVRTTAGSP